MSSNLAEQLLLQSRIRSWSHFAYQVVVVSMLDHHNAYNTRVSFGFQQHAFDFGIRTLS